MRVSFSHLFWCTVRIEHWKKYKPDLLDLSKDKMLEDSSEAENADPVRFVILTISKKKKK